VVRWHAVEELSKPFAYDVTLRRSSEQGPIDLGALLDTPATFAAAAEHRWRLVHGIVAEVEEVDRTAALYYYRLLLVPPFFRALHRRHCRTFARRTLKEIVTSILENRSEDGSGGAGGLIAHNGDFASPPLGRDLPAFVAPSGRYRWLVSDDSRIAHPTLYAFVVQYNETDFDFVSRLLEAEGLTYYFEHTEGAVVMVLTDRPGQKPLCDEEAHCVLRSTQAAGAGQGQEVIRSLRASRRMRPQAVTVRDHDWRRSLQCLEGSAEQAQGTAALDHFEFALRDDTLASGVGKSRAAARLERFRAEDLLRDGISTVRTLSPGHVVAVHDDAVLRDDEEMLIVRVETFATQLGAGGSSLEHEPFGFAGRPQQLGVFENRFVSLAADTAFRPPPTDTKPRLWGLQEAVVSAEEITGAAPNDPNLTAEQRKQSMDIFTDPNNEGCVQVRFPWDQRPPRAGTPASSWVRVSHAWAGGQFGAFYLPRVGHSVLVAFLDGDPDRPVIVGRVYTGQNPPPVRPSDSAEAASTSTLKSNSSTIQAPDEGFNELRFVDLKAKELVYLQAERNLDELVKADHSTSVGGNQSNTVGGNQSNTVYQNRTHTIVGTEEVHVASDRTTKFDANESHSVGVNRSTEIGAVERLEVGGSRAVIVHGPDMAVVDSDDVTQVGGVRTVQVTGNHNVQTSANYHSTASANHTFKSTNMYITQSGEFQVNAASLWLNVGGCSLRMSAGNVSISNGAGATIMMAGSLITITGTNVVVTGGSTIQTLSGGPTNLTAGGDINAAAANIHLNG